MNESDAKLLRELANSNSGVLRWTSDGELTVATLRELLAELPGEWTVHCVRGGKVRPCVLVRLHPSTRRVSFDYVTDVRLDVDLGYDSDGDEMDVM